MKTLKELIYPRRCVFCRGFLDKNTVGDVCPDCRATLPFTGNKCKSGGEFFKDCFSPLWYSGNARAAVLRYKFSGRAVYAKPMARMIAECLRANSHMDFDVVTWVPLSARRKRKRGYCQAKLLAKVIGKELGLDCVRLLRRHRHTPPQSGIKGLAARKANISGAFKTVREDDIAGRSVLLVDDIITTGATLAECTRMLLMAGAREVNCATLCRARKK